MSSAQPPQAEGPEPPPGIVCPRCGCRHMLSEAEAAASNPARHWKTTKTERHDGYIRRRRVCRHCGRTVYTREAIEN